MDGAQLKANLSLRQFTLYLKGSDDEDDSWARRRRERRRLGISPQGDGVTKGTVNLGR